jgi:acyl-CoA synthetase (AMP-forming)/AMP-acid ligase II
LPTDLFGQFFPYQGIFLPRKAFKSHYKILSIEPMSVCFDSSLNVGCECSTFVDLLTYRAQTQPNRTAYVFLHRGETEVGRLTYQELDRQARAIAARLQSLGATGERALLLYQPGLEFVAAFMGCMYASVVAVPAYPPRRNQKLTRLQAILDNAGAMVVLTTSTLLENVERRFAEDPQLATMQWLTTDNIASELASDWQKPTISSDTLAFLQYTSGSTGTPKGVMVSHGNLLHNSALIHKCFEHTPDSRGVIWLPPYHDMGLIGGVLQPLYGGFPVALMSPVDFLQQPLRWLQAISRYRGTTSGGPNFAYELACSKITPEQKASLDLSSWEVAFTGAEPVRAETIERFAATFEPCGFRKEAFYPCYGMAETTLIVSGGLKVEIPVVQQVEGAALEQNRVVAARGEEGSRKIVGCGKSLVDGKIAIVDPKSLTLLPDNQVGEIWVAGSSVAQGYWERPQETEATFNAYLADTGEGPFLRTGDLGFLQEGELFIAGRIKDAIIIRGQNHYPQDIELTVEKSHPALRPNCGAAFAVEVNGSERLVIVQEVKRSYLRKLNVKEVVESIRRAVTAEHNLQVYATVLVKTESIPKTSSGKIQRHACRTGFLAGTLNVVEDWSENPKSKVKFLQLQADVESILEKLQAVKRVSNQ